MEAKWSGTCLLLLASAALACSDSSTGPSAGDLVGTWEATKVEYVSVSQPVQTEDLVADGGSATLVLSSQGGYVYTVTPAGGSDQIELGTWSLDGDVMTVNPNMTNFSLQFDVSLSGNTLSLTGADSEYDFDGDQQFESATLNLAFTRTS